LAELLGKHHGDVRRPIPERWIARALEERRDVIWRTKRDRGARNLASQCIRACAHSFPLDLGAAGAGFDSGFASGFFDSVCFDSVLELDDSLPFALSLLAESGFAVAVVSVFALSAFVDSDEDSPCEDPSVLAVGGASPRCAFLP
jgi:hypothetical protein